MCKREFGDTFYIDLKETKEILFAMDFELLHNYSFELTGWFEFCESHPMYWNRQDEIALAVESSERDYWGGGLEPLFGQHHNN